MPTPATSIKKSIDIYQGSIRVFRRTGESSGGRRPPENTADVRQALDP